MADFSKIGRFFNMLSGEYKGTEDFRKSMDKRLDKGKKLSINKPTSYRTYKKDEEGSFINEKNDNPDVGDTRKSEEDKLAGIQSTAIDNIDYDPKKKIASVTFKGGSKAYDYKVSPSEMKQMIDAPSKGQHLAKVWKKYNRLPGY